MSCVQLLQIPLSAPIDAAASSANTEWAKITEILGKAPGIVSTTWAPQHEDSKIGGIAASWKSHGDYKAWAKTSDAETVKALTKKIATGDIYEDVVVFPGDTADSLGAAVVELVSWIHPTSKIDEKLKKEVLDGFAIFADAIMKRAPEADGGLIGGWGENEFEHEGTPSKRFTAFIGWKSVEAHYECKKTPPFTENIHHLMDHHDTGVEMVHYPYVQSTKAKI